MRIHAGTGPLSYRLERMIARVEAEGRAADFSRRIELRDDRPSRTCDRCGFFLLPGEATTCCHCAAGKVPDTE